MVKDTARAMKFYNELLGIKQIESQVPNPEITWLQLDNGIMVHLIETDKAPVNQRTPITHLRLRTSKDHENFGRQRV
ncbi:MAG: hypothetical protein CM1200mP27_04940 [Chloroflexota bacterium]|nr:MAG: hypothetical protein CM1200mP27_04940 [Chloroflexota bacterium]